METRFDSAELIHVFIEYCIFLFEEWSRRGEKDFAHTGLNTRVRKEDWPGQMF